MRTITVVNQEVKRSGTTNGRQWTVRSVQALDEKGDPMAQDLISFETLPENEPIEVELIEKAHPTYGISYRIRRKGATNGNGASAPVQQVNAALEKRVESLNSFVEALDARLQALEEWSQE